MASATSLMPMFRLVSRSGSSRTRTAYFWEPYTCTWATPLTMEIRSPRVVAAYSLRVDSGSVSDFMASMRIGESAGLTFR